MNNKLGLSLLFLFFTLPYSNCFNENKICNIFNPCNECMKVYSEKVIKMSILFSFGNSLEYSSGKILGAYGRIFAISSDGEVKFSLKLERTERTGFYFIFPPILHNSKYYAVSECGEVVVINEKEKIIKKAILDNDDLISQAFIKDNKLYINNLKIYDIDSFKLVERKNFEGMVAYSDKIGFAVYSPPTFSCT